MTDGYKIFQLYCDRCHWKKITNGEDIGSLYEIKTSSIQTSLPKYDDVAKKTVETKFQKQNRKFKCPSCGHSVILKQITDTQKSLDAQKEIEKRTTERKELEESILREQNRREYEKKDRIEGS